MEFLFGWSRSSIYKDIFHVLLWLSHALEHFVAWPDEEERWHLASIHPGLFHHVIGLADITEHRIYKSKDRRIEKQTYSAKASCNTLKTLTVIDYRGYFRFVSTGMRGSMPDREVFTSSCLYLQKHLYFSNNEVFAADGIFNGILTTFI